MKTYTIPEGATHVLVTDGPVSFVTPALEPEPLLGVWANNTRKERNRELLPEGEGEHDDQKIATIMSLFDRTSANLTSELVFRRSQFRQWRLDKGLTQQDCAELSGAYEHGNSIGNIETGTNRPNKKFVEWAADQMEVPISILLDITAEVS